MDIFVISIIRTVVLLLGATHLTVYQTKKPDRHKASAGGGYILIWNGEFVHFKFADLKNGTLKARCRDKIPVIEGLGDFDYKDLVEQLRKEFGEK